MGYFAPTEGRFVPHLELWTHYFNPGFIVEGFLVAWTDGVKSVFPSFQRGSRINNQTTSPLPFGCFGTNHSESARWHLFAAICCWCWQSPWCSSTVVPLLLVPRRAPGCTCGCFPSSFLLPGRSGLDGCAGGDSGIENRDIENVSRGFGVLRVYKLRVIERISNLKWN